MKIKTLIPLLASCPFLLCGCIAPQQQSETAVAYISKDVPLSRIKGAIIDVYLADGWQLGRESEHLITFIKENKNFMVQLFHSSNYESRVFNRESVIISENGDRTTIRASQEVITNYGSPFEKAEPTTSPNSLVRLSSVKAGLH